MKGPLPTIHLHPHVGKWGGGDPVGPPYNILAPTCGEGEGSPVGPSYNMHTPVRERGQGWLRVAGEGGRGGGGGTVGPPYMTREQSSLTKCNEIRRVGNSGCNTLVLL